MYVCSCHVVTDGDIREAVKDGVRTFAELSRKTKLGTNCHICARSAKAIFNEALRLKNESSIPDSSGAVAPCHGSKPGGCAACACGGR